MRFQPRFLPEDPNAILPSRTHQQQSWGTWRAFSRPSFHTYSTHTPLYKVLGSDKVTTVAAGSESSDDKISPAFGVLPFWQNLTAEKDCLIHNKKLRGMDGG